MSRPRTATCGVCGRRGQVVGRCKGWLRLTAQGYYVRTPSTARWAHVTPYDDDLHTFQPPRFPRTLSARGPAVRLAPTARNNSLTLAEIIWRRERAFVNRAAALSRDYENVWRGIFTAAGIGWIS